MTHRILHVYKDYHPVRGGIEGHVRCLAEAQAAQGHDVSVLVFATEGPTQSRREKGVNVVRARRWGTVASMPMGPAMPRALRSMKVDVTHIHNPFPFGEFFQRRLGRSKVTVVTHHCEAVRQKKALVVYRPWLRRFLRDCDAVIATSPNALQNSGALAHIRASCHVVPLGTTISFEADSQKAAPEPCPLLFVGRLRHYKGVDVLLKAMAQVSDAHLNIVGTGPEQASLMALVRDLKLADRVTFMGEISDEVLNQKYSESIGLVLPSTSPAEAFGLVLIEAMARGRPVISTELGTGTSWVNEHGKTGWVVAPNSPEALAGAMNEMLADEPRREQLGRNGRERVAQEFSIEVMVDRINAIYEECLKIRR